MNKCYVGPVGIFSQRSGCEAAPQKNGPLDVGIGQLGIGQNLCVASIRICALVIPAGSRGKVHLNDRVLPASIAVGPTPMTIDFSMLPLFSSTVPISPHANWISVASNNTLGLETVNGTSNGCNWSDVPGSITRAAGHSGGPPETAEIDETMPNAATMEASMIARTRTNGLTMIYSQLLSFRLPFQAPLPHAQAPRAEHGDRG